MNRIRACEIVGDIEAVSLSDCTPTGHGQIVPRSAGGVSEGDSARLKIWIPNGRAINPKHGIGWRCWGAAIRNGVTIQIDGYIVCLDIETRCRGAYVVLKRVNGSGVGQCLTGSNWYADAGHADSDGIDVRAGLWRGAGILYHSSN